jgi:hypothetical protein
MHLERHAPSIFNEILSTQDKSLPNEQLLQSDFSDRLLQSQTFYDLLNT